jgi:hypothetical protein
MVHSVESVASNPPFATAEVGEGALDAETVLVDAMVEVKTSAEVILEEMIVDELTACVEDSTEVEAPGVEVTIVDVTLKTVDEGVPSIVEDASILEVGTELEESVDSAWLVLDMT